MIYNKYTANLKIKFVVFNSTWIPNGKYMKNKNYKGALVKTLALHELELEQINIVGKMAVGLFCKALEAALEADLDLEVGPQERKYKKEILDIQAFMLRETNAFKNPLNALTDIFIHDKYKKYLMNFELPSKPVQNKICSLLKEIKILNEIEKAKIITEDHQKPNVEQKKSFTPS